MPKFHCAQIKNPDAKPKAPERHKAIVAVEEAKRASAPKSQPKDA